MEKKKDFMQEALKEARKAYDKEEVPIGAVIVKDDKVIARAHNLREIKKQACSHAEILAIQKACKKLDAWRLEDCDMYVTLEPCPMCTGACINARVGRVVFGAYDPKAGCCGTLYNLGKDRRFNHNMEIIGGVRETECGEMLTNFFKNIREGKR